MAYNFPYKNDAFLASTACRTNRGRNTMLSNRANQNAGMPVAYQVQQAMSLHQQGKLEEAESLYQAVLRVHTKQVECLHYLGVIKFQTGRHQEAVDLIKKAISLNKNNPEAHSNLGLALHGNGRHQLAIESYARALALNPRHPDALNNRANVQRDLGRLDAALKDYDAALAIQPNFPLAWTNRADVLRRLERLGEALASYDKALAQRPTAELCVARAGVLLSLHRRDEAQAGFEQALKLAPANVDAWNQMAGNLYLMGRHDEALRALEEALKLKPQSADLRLKQAVVKLPIIRSETDDVEAIRAGFGRDIAAFDQWLQDNPVDNPMAVVGGAHPFYLAYHDANNRELLSGYGAMCSRLMQGWANQHGLQTPPARAPGVARIRIGIVSAHIVEHPVWRAIVRGWMSELDSERFELHVFYLGTVEDGETAYARSRAAAFHHGARSELEWARLITAAAVDVLIYPELGMDAVAPRLAAMRLASRQAVTWGHPETTGLPSIDAYLSAADMEGEMAQGQYSEQLVRLPNLGCHYEPAEVPREDVDLAALGVQAGVPLFVCPGAPFKYAPEYDQALVDIARRVGPSQFLFFSNGQARHLTDKLRQRVARAFEAAGLDPNAHLVSAPWQSRARFYSIMRQADVFLDTIGFSGFNTAMQAVDCALPIATIEGGFMRGRFGSAILRRMGLDALVQADAAGYVDLAVKLATEPAFKTATQAAMMERRAVLYRDTAPIRALEQFVEQWCADGQ